MRKKREEREKTIVKPGKFSFSSGKDFLIEIFGRANSLYR